MRNLGLHQSELQRFGRHLQTQILTEIERAGDFGGGGWARILTAPNFSVSRQLEFQRFHFHLVAQHFAGVHDGVHNRFITGAAAGIMMFG